LQARHLLFDLKQETGREYNPIRTRAQLKSVRDGHIGDDSTSTVIVHP